MKTRHIEKFERSLNQGVADLRKTLTGSFTEQEINLSISCYKLGFYRAQATANLITDTIIIEEIKNERTNKPT